MGTDTYICTHAFRLHYMRKWGGGVGEVNGPLKWATGSISNLTARLWHIWLTHRARYGIPGQKGNNKNKKHWNIKKTFSWLDSLSTDRSWWNWRNRTTGGNAKLVGNKKGKYCSSRVCHYPVVSLSKWTRAFSPPLQLISWVLFKWFGVDGRKFKKRTRMEI